MTYDTRLPVLRSTTPAVNTTVSSLTQVMVVLNDQLSGIDLSNTQTTLSHNGAQIGATVRYIGKTTVGLIIAEPISQAGEYVIEVTPVDFAGNVGANTKIPFFFTEATSIIGLVPDVTDPVSELTNITAQITNYVGPKIDFSKSTITLKTAEGETVSANPIENDGLEQLQWKILHPLPGDVSVDGSYVLNVSYVDVAENVTERWSGKKTPTKVLMVKKFTKALAESNTISMISHSDYYTTVSYTHLTLPTSDLV